MTWTSTSKSSVTQILIPDARKHSRYSHRSVWKRSSEHLRKAEHITVTNVKLPTLPQSYFTYFAFSVTFQSHHSAPVPRSNIAWGRRDDSHLRKEFVSRIFRRSVHKAKANQSQEHSTCHSDEKSTPAYCARILISKDLLVGGLHQKVLFHFSPPVRHRWKTN